MSANVFRRRQLTSEAGGRRAQGRSPRHSRSRGPLDESLGGRGPGWLRARKASPTIRRGPKDRMRWGSNSSGGGGGGGNSTDRWDTDAKRGGGGALMMAFRLSESMRLRCHTTVAKASEGDVNVRAAPLLTHTHAHTQGRLGCARGAADDTQHGRRRRWPSERTRRVVVR
jgi:hypothetical protein